MTREQAIRMCDRLGVPITRRRITDWIQKGLLPQHRQQGRGRGEGKGYYWDQPCIGAQILAACALMEWHNRSEHVLWMLFLNGFPIEVHRVRNVWLNAFVGRRDQRQSQYPDPFDWDEKIDKSVLKATMKVAKTESAQENASKGLLAIAAKTVMSDTSLEDLLDGIDVRELLGHMNHGEAPTEDVDVGLATWVTNSFEFLEQHFSLQARIELLQTATNEELTEAQRDWGKLLRFVEPFFRSTMADTAWPNLAWASFWWKLMVRLGGYAILFDLALRKTGFTSNVEETVKLLEKPLSLECARLARQLRIQQSRPPIPESLKVFIDQLREIWTQNPIKKTQTRE